VSRSLLCALALLATLVGGCRWFEVDEDGGPADAGPPGASGRLVVPALGPGDEFGAAVAGSPDVLAIGAPGDDREGSQAGAVHIFRPGDGAWSEESVVTGDDARTGDRFGTSVALAGDLLAVGAPGRDGDGSWSGAVFLLRADGAAWQAVATLGAPDGAVGDRFGASVAFLDPDHLAIGASGHDADQPGGGATYLFERQGDMWMAVR